MSHVARSLRYVKREGNSVHPSFQAWEAQSEAIIGKVECVTTSGIANTHTLAQMKSGLSDEGNKLTQALGSVSNKEKLDLDKTLRESQIN
jgi:hypothetical protein